MTDWDGNWNQFNFPLESLLRQRNMNKWKNIGTEKSPYCLSDHHWKHINPLRQRQNGHHFTDDPCNRIFFNEPVRISIKISLRFVPKGPIKNIPELFHITACHRPSGKPFYEPMMVCLLMHICLTQPQWVNNKWLEKHGSIFSTVVTKALVLKQQAISTPSAN